MSSVNILILTYRHVISMKNRTLEVRGPPLTLTALDSSFPFYFDHHLLCQSWRLSVSISYTWAFVHSIYPSTSAPWQIHKHTWLISDIPCTLLHRPPHSSCLLTAPSPEPNAQFWCVHWVESLSLRDPSDSWITVISSIHYTVICRKFPFSHFFPRSHLARISTKKGNKSKPSKPV